MAEDQEGYLEIHGFVVGSYQKFMDERLGFGRGKQCIGESPLLDRDERESKVSRFGVRRDTDDPRFLAAATSRTLERKSYGSRHSCPREG